MNNLAVLFVGPDDAGTCDGCDEAVNGNPYTVNNAPAPGEFECGSRCRHILQIDGDAPDGFAPYSWSGQLGFELADEAADPLEQLVAQDATPAQIAQFMDANGLTTDDLVRVVGVDELEGIEAALAATDDTPESLLADALADGDADAARDFIHEHASDELLKHALGRAQSGFSDPVSAYTLADVLSTETLLPYEVVLGQDRKWYVYKSLQESMREGGVGSGNFGHHGVKGQVGGSAPNLGAHLKRVAQIHEKAQHQPGAPETQKAYAALKAETLNQYQQLVAKGVRFNFTDKDPYTNSKSMMADAAKGNLKVYTGGTLPADHPLAQIESTTGQTFNNIFRGVHDYNGHFLNGNTFSARGELGAYQAHAQMYSKEALPALAAETLAQNSWVNYFGDHQSMGPADRPFADQKAYAFPLNIAKPIADGRFPRASVFKESDTLDRIDLTHLVDIPDRRHIRGRIRVRAKEGGSGSGNFDHAGRPGEVGGSGAGDGDTVPCQRCGGTGIIPAYVSVNGGECFGCEGTGRQEAAVVSKRAAVNAKAQAKAEEKRIAKVAASQAEGDRRWGEFANEHPELAGKLEMAAANERIGRRSSLGAGPMAYAVMVIRRGENRFATAAEFATHALSRLREGGAGSGNFGHEGRPGEVGGSGAGGGHIPMGKDGPSAVAFSVEEARGLAGRPGIRIQRDGERIYPLNSNGLMVEVDKLPERVRTVILDEVAKNQMVQQGAGLYPPDKSPNVAFLGSGYAHFTQEGNSALSKGPVNVHAAAITLSTPEGVTGIVFQPDNFLGGEADTVDLAGRTKPIGVGFTVPQRYATTVEDFDRMIVDHEMGHVLDRMNPQHPASSRPEWLAVLCASDPGHSARTPSALEDGLSKYAVIGGPHEAFAEAYTAYVNKQPLPDSMSRYFDHLINGKRLKESMVNAPGADYPIAFADDFEHGRATHIYADGRRITYCVDGPTLREGSPDQPRDDHGRWATGAEVSGPQDGTYKGVSLFNAPKKPEAVFMLGGSASGKGGVIAANYAEHYHMDPDTVKASIPLYTPKVDAGGTHGPSGPMTYDEYQDYPEREKAATEQWVRDNTPYSSVQDFAQNVLSDHNPNGGFSNFGGGLTHELSSAVAKAALVQEVTNSSPRNWIYDATGSNNYRTWADMAQQAGYKTVFHQVYLPQDIAQARNATRDRSVPDAVLAQSHAKVRDIVPGLRSWAANHGVEWRYTDNT
jgi:hypothetical protein